MKRKNELFNEVISSITKEALSKGAKLVCDSRFPTLKPEFNTEEEKLYIGNSLATYTKFILDGFCYYIQCHDLTHAIQFSKSRVFREKYIPRNGYIHELDSKHGLDPEKILDELINSNKYGNLELPSYMIPKPSDSIELSIV